MNAEAVDVLKPMIMPIWLVNNCSLNQNHHLICVWTVMELMCWCIQTGIVYAIETVYHCTTGWRLIATQTCTPCIDTYTHIVWLLVGHWVYWMPHL